MNTSCECSFAVDPDLSASQGLSDSSRATGRLHVVVVALVFALTVFGVVGQSRATAIAEVTDTKSLTPAGGQRFSPTDLERVQVGDTAPRFRLPSSKGGTFDLDDVVGDGRVVLVFYRGHWCSACARELAEMSREVHSRAPSTPIYAISTDTLSESSELAELIGDSGYPTESLHFLEDERHRVIDRYGVLNKAAGDTAYRAVFVLDSRGIVIWRAVENGHNHDHESLVAELIEQLEKPPRGS